MFQIILFQLTSDDELILAVDSPVLQGNMAAPSIQITSASQNASFPTEVWALDNCACVEWVSN